MGKLHVGDWVKFQSGVLVEVREQDRGLRDSPEAFNILEVRPRPEISMQVSAGLARQLTKAAAAALAGDTVAGTGTPTLDGRKIRQAVEEADEARRARRVTEATEAHAHARHAFLDTAVLQLAGSLQLADVLWVTELRRLDPLHAAATQPDPPREVARRAYQLAEALWAEREARRG